VPSHSRKIGPDFFNRITCFLNPEDPVRVARRINNLQVVFWRGFRNPHREIADGSDELTASLVLFSRCSFPRMRPECEL
jgi:hypothetical protein